MKIQPRRRRNPAPRLEVMEERMLLAANPPAAPTTPMSDVQAIQRHASSDHLVDFLAQLGTTLSTRTDVQQLATQILASHESSDPQIESAAMAANILLPSDISDPADQAPAKQVLAAVNTTNFDQVLLNTLVQAEQGRGTASQTFLASTQNAALKQAIQSEVAVDAQNLSQAQSLLAAPGTTGSLTQGSGSGTPTNDVEYVQQSHSTNEMEILLSQAAALASSRNDVQLYAQKLISDHSQSDLQSHELAQYLGTPLTSTLSQTDLATARQVLAALNTANFDRTYLQANVQAHQTDIATNQQEINRTQDPNVKQYAKDDIPTDTMHLMSAQTLLNGGTGTSNDPLGFLLNGIDTTKVTNVRVSFRHRNSRTLSYTVRFDSGGRRYTQSYNLFVSGRRGNNQNNGLTDRQAVNYFLDYFNNRLSQEPQFGRIGQFVLTKQTVSGPAGTFASHGQQQQHRTGTVAVRSSSAARAHTKFYPNRPGQAVSDISGPHR